MEAMDGVQLLRTLALHNRHVEGGLLRVRQELERRAHHHDDSKLWSDEFAGFAEINGVAREHPFGSPQYNASLAASRRAIDLHYSRNSHHPEHHADPTQMSWLDIIEMVCDWRGAWIAYGSQRSWPENMETQRQKLSEVLTAEQWWLVEQVAAFLVPA